MRQILWSVLIALTSLGAQQPPANAPATEGPAKFTSTAQLVVETLIVKDKNGNPVEGLTARDFTITEDGKPQAIAFCEFQKLKDVENEVPAFAPRSNIDTPAVDKVTKGQISPEQPGNIQDRGRRMLGKYFDMSAMPVPDQLRALNAAQKFIRTRMTPQDVVAIMKFSGSGVEVLVDFTDNRDELLATLQKLILGDQNTDEDPNDESSGDTGAAFGQDNSEFNIFTTDRQLAALQTAVKMLGTLNEKKALIYFASDLRLNGTNN